MDSLVFGQLGPSLPHALYAAFSEAAVIALLTLLVLMVLSKHRPERAAAYSPERISSKAQRHSCFSRESMKRLHRWTYLDAFMTSRMKPL